MKKAKYVIFGILIGLLMSVSFTVAADTVSLIGKKIGGESEVLLNGEYLDTAIIVNGKSYAPVRAIGEAAGYDVDFINKKVILETPKEEAAVEVDMKAAIESKMNSVKNQGYALIGERTQLELKLINNPEDTESKDKSKVLDEKIKELDDEYNKLKAELEAIESAK